MIMSWNSVVHLPHYISFVLYESHASSWQRLGEGWTSKPTRGLATAPSD